MFSNSGPKKDGDPKPGDHVPQTLHIFPLQVYIAECNRVRRLLARRSQCYDVSQLQFLSKANVCIPARPGNRRQLSAFSLPWLDGFSGMDLCHCLRQSELCRQSYRQLKGSELGVHL